MDENALKPGDGSPAEVVLVRRAIRGESLSPAEWASIPTRLLCAGAFLLFGRFLELGLSAVDDAARPTSDVEAEFRKLITDKSRYLDQQQLEAIERSSRAAELLPEAQLNRGAHRALSHEIARRAVTHAPATFGMLAARSKQVDASGPSLKMLYGALEIDRLEDYRSPDESPDLKQLATASAVEKFNDVWQRGWEEIVKEFKNLPVVEAPRMFAPTLDPRRWKRANIYRMAFVWLGSGLAPIFAGDPDALPQAARDSYRNVLEQRDAKKRGGTGGRHEKAQERPVTVDFDDLRESELSSGPTGPQCGPAERIIAVAVEHLGPKAARYFKELGRPDVTQKAAAKAAGISDGMARRYQRQMRRFLRD
jgi:hypothetical protein